MAEQDNVMLLGVDPQQAIGGDNPTIGMTFVQGDRDTAIRKLSEGRYCLVPDHFHVETGLGVGDRFGVIPPNAPDTELAWEIAGVVAITGWQWVTKMSDMRRNAPKTLAAVFISYDNARRDFELDRVSYFWANTRDGTDVRELQKALEPIAERNGSVKFQLAGVGEVTTAKPYVSVTDVREVERIVRWRTESVLWMMSKFPLIVLGIMTLAVVNTIMASIRARRWELGVLRAVGLTRGGLTRLVFAEAILVGLVACVLSLAFGTMAAWCANGICTYIFYFGGMQPPLVIPWTKLLLGFSGTLGLCVLAALLPAIAAGRTEPAKLLQAGRAAM
jgi:putative ABC transport system permease protein